LIYVKLTGKYVGDCFTAGSIALMIQMILPSLLFTKDSSIVTLKVG
jgi:RNA 3''-terminal phosphate cyclase